MTEEAEFVFIRKFGSVSSFLERVRQLDNTLDNIESFTQEVMQLKVNNRSADEQARPALIDNRAADGAGKDCLLVDAPGIAAHDAAPDSELNICCICLDR